MKKLSHRQLLAHQQQQQERNNRRSSMRKKVRSTPTPPGDLQGHVDQLFRQCVQQLPKAFDDNKVKMEAFIDFHQALPSDVVEALKKRFPGWTVEHTFSDSVPMYDHLSFQLPANWLERLLKA